MILTIFTLSLKVVMIIFEVRQVVIDVLTNQERHILTIRLRAKVFYEQILGMLVEHSKNS